MSTLVYLCHFGDDVHGDYLVATVTALQTIGNYQGDLFIYTDNYERTIAIIRQLPNRDKICVIASQNQRGLFTRYAAAHYLAKLYAEQYTNFLYIDNDVLCTRDINPVIQAMEESPAELKGYTQRFYRKYDPTKQNRLDPYTVAYPPKHDMSVLVLYPAIFAFKPTEKVVKMFEVIKDLRYTVAEYRYNLGYDIAAYSFEAYKFAKSLDRSIIDSNVSRLSHTDLKEKTVVETPFAHFEGFKDKASKLYAMVEFIKKNAGDRAEEVSIISTFGNEEV